MGLGRGHGCLAPAPWPPLGRTTTWPTKYDSADVALTHTCHHHSPLSSVCQWHTCTADQAVGAREGAYRLALSPLWVFVCGRVYAFTGPRSCVLPRRLYVSQSPRGPSSALAAPYRVPRCFADVAHSRGSTVSRPGAPCRRLCGVCSPPRSRDGVSALRCVQVRPPRAPQRAPTPGGAAGAAAPTRNRPMRRCGRCRMILGAAQSRAPQKVRSKLQVIEKITWS